MSTVLQVKGQVVAINQPQTLNTFSFQTAIILIDQDSQYPQHVEIQFSGNALPLVNNLFLNAVYNFSLNVRGSKNVMQSTKTPGVAVAYTTFSVWKFEQDQQQQGNYQQQQQPAQQQQNFQPQQQNFQPQQTQNFQQQQPQQQGGYVGAPSNQQQPQQQQNFQPQQNFQDQQQGGYQQPANTGAQPQGFNPNAGVNNFGQQPQQNNNFTGPNQA